MNNFEHNNTVNEIVDVPYYTRELCKDSKYRLTKRNIKSENVLKYRREISSINVNNDFFLTKNLKQSINNAIKFFK